MKKKNILLLALGLPLLASCNKFLDLVPENDITTIPSIYEVRKNVEEQEADCYSYISSLAAPPYNIGMMASDEWVANQYARDVPQGLNKTTLSWANVADGQQNVQAPMDNKWTESSYYCAIRYINLFLKYVPNTYDMTDNEKKEWMAEVKMLKAFIYFQLVKRYGPIILVPENIEANASLNEMKQPRQPIDTCFNAIVSLIDEAISDGLLSRSQQEASHQAYFNRESALALKAVVLTYAASPLFNGNTDYSDFKNKNGELLFPQQYDAEKWHKAAVACDEALKACEAAGYKLVSGSTSKSTKLLNTMMDLEKRTEAPSYNNSEQISAVGLLVLALTKCTNISVNPGWECLRTTWTPSKDPAVKNIRITWISENSDTATAEVVPTDTAYTIKGLTNQNYQVMVQSIAQDGTPSLTDKITRRPYTYEHEAVTAFTQGFNKYYLYKNHLLLFMGNWSDGIVKFDIAYTNKQGKADTLHLTKDVFNEQNVDVADVDFTKDITLQRRGMIEGCPDTIDFQPVKLTKNFLMNTDFKKELRQHYGLSNDDVENFAASAQTVGVDYDLYSLEDLLYFTNLKTLNLGARRYMLSSHLMASTVTELKRSQWVITKLHEIGGVTVNMYANAYFGASAPSFVNKHSVVGVPVSEFYSGNSWSIATSVDDSNNSELKNLLDGSATTDWKSWPSDKGVRTFALITNMKADKTVHSVAIVQSQNADMVNFEPEAVSVEYATASAPDTWTSLNGIDEYTLGTAQGETTLIKAAQAVNARYLRVTVKERTYNSVTRVALADIKVY